MSLSVPAGRRPKILLCEDDEMVRRMMHLALRPLAVDVVSAADGEAGLALAERELPDLIIADRQMPRMGGLDLQAQLRLRPRLASIPLILMSGEPEALTAAISEHHRLAGYLSKPFGLEAIRQAVTAHLGKVAPGP